MPKDTGYYGSYGDRETGAEFKPKGEPEKRDNRGTIEGAGVPATPPVVAFEPDQDAASHPFAPGEVVTVRRTTNEKSQPIEDTGVPSVEPGIA